ncbi:hypothetical protein T11_2527, partial [Trichinella zimbabwensis]
MLPLFHHHPVCGTDVDNDRLGPFGRQSIAVQPRHHYEKQQQHLVFVISWEEQTGLLFDISDRGNFYILPMLCGIQSKGLWVLKNMVFKESEQGWIVRNMYADFLYSAYRLFSIDRYRLTVAIAIDSIRLVVGGGPNFQDMLLVDRPKTNPFAILTEIVALLRE